MNRDILNRFVFESHDCRGEIVSLAASYQEVLDNGNYPQVVKELLGEFLSAVVLLSATLKFEGVLTLQARGDGPVPLLMAESNHKSNVRGVARTSSEAELPASCSDFRELLGKGHLVVTVDPDKGERYQGVIPLAKPTLAGCLEDYFALSEQLPTRFWLAADGERASGLLLQRLPRQVASDEENRDYWEHITTLASSLTSREMLSLDHDSLLYRLYHQEEVRLFEPRDIMFNCSCSRDRTAAALMSLGADEVTAMLAEQGVVRVDCQFCHANYEFNEGDIKAIFNQEPTLH